MSGTPISQLRCPTCGEPYSFPLVAHYEHEVFDVDLVLGSSQVARKIGRPYIECDFGHKWTIKALSRNVYAREDEILLGEYIGD